MIFPTDTTKNLVRIICLCALLMFSCTENPDNAKKMEEQLEEVKLHLSHGNISQTLHDKLSEYIESGGFPDTDDWLFYIQKKFRDEGRLDIKNLQEQRYSEVDFEETSTVAMLKKAGFFADISFTPGKPIIRVQQRELVEQSVKIAFQDYDKLISLDIEGEVWEGNKDYTRFLKKMKDFTQGLFSPEEIKEIWKTPIGPIDVRYTLKGQAYSFHPEYVGDWYDLPDVFTQINEALSKEAYGLYTISAEYITGQELPILFLHKKEKEILEKELDWQLSLLF